MKHAALVMALLASAAGCATMQTTTGETQWVGSTLVDTVAWDHFCPAEKIRIIRTGANRSSDDYDLYVCGQVRRYKLLGGWVDVTALYPPTSLPAATP